jgi:ribosomal protein S18 acetylase RimI-like enzyme
MTELVPISIRRAGVRDAAALTAVAARLFEQTFGAANTPEDMQAFLAATYTLEKQTAELADQSRAAWLAEDASGAAIGFAQLRRGTTSDGVMAERPAEVQRIYADQSVHGRGVGRMLMERCVDQARAWGCDVLWLAVWEHNPRAIAFYEKEGFQRVGKQVFQLGSDMQHDQVMARNLSLSG